MLALHINSWGLKYAYIQLAAAVFIPSQRQREREGKR